jgi:hypothetical protein
MKKETFLKTGWRRHAATGCLVVLLAFLAGPDRRPVVVLTEMPASVVFPAPVAPEETSVKPPQAEIDEESHAVWGTPKIISESPFQIAAQINRRKREDGPEYDFSALWDRLGFSRKEKNGLAEPPAFLREGAHPRAEVENRDLDGKPGLETVLTVTNTNFDGHRLFIIFRHSGAKWHFLGALETFFRWKAPKWRAKSFAGRTFFTFDEESCYGSAYGCRYESWFEISGDRIHPAFYFQNSGYSGGMRSALDQDTVPRTVDRNRLRLDVSYSLPDGTRAKDAKRAPLRITREFFFNWNEQRHQFEFDAATSGLTEAEFKAACDTSEQAWDQTAFFKTFEKQLRDAALRGNPATKKDLRFFLEEWGDASTNAPLLELLDRQP